MDGVLQYLYLVSMLEWSPTLQLYKLSIIISNVITHTHSNTIHTNKVNF